MSRKEHARKIAYICIILILVLLILFSGLRILESTVFLKDQGQEYVPVSKTISRNGVDYYPRQDITTVLVMGIDETGPVKDSGSYNNTGEVDMLALVIFDEANQVCNVLALNRDTMVQMPVLGIGGRKAGTKYGQLALSHTYGSGLEDSCENTCETVSTLLYGCTVDYYVAMNMDAISIVNDAVGGVTVNVTDDFSSVDPTIQMGEMTLMGQQAINYVQVRKELGDQKNVSRMERQKEYMAGFLTALRQANKDEGFLLTTYDAVSPYIVTDCSSTVLSSLLSRYEDYPLNEMVSPEGENVVNNGYYEFRLDEDALDALILRLLYAPKN